MLIAVQHLPTELRVVDALRFPIATREARKDLLIGGVLLLTLLIVGWILNLGNRLNVVSRLGAGDRPYFRAFRPWGYTFRRGCISFAAITSYLSPAIFFGILAFGCRSTGWVAPYYGCAAASALAFGLGVFTLPGCMTVYAVEGDSRVLRRPVGAFLRARRHRRMYLFAWWIALLSVVLSFAGLLLLGVGFLFTSVWAWDVVGYAFTVAMYSRESDTQ